MTLPDLESTTTLADTEARLAQWMAMDWPAPPLGPDDEDPVAQAVMWLASSLNEILAQTRPIGPFASTPEDIALHTQADIAAKRLWTTLLDHLPTPLGVRWTPHPWRNQGPGSNWPMPPVTASMEEQVPCLWVGVVQAMGRIDLAQDLLSGGLQLPPLSGVFHHFMRVGPSDLAWQDDWHRLRAAGADPTECYGLAFDSGEGTLAHLAVELSLYLIDAMHPFHQAVLQQAHAEGLDLCQMGQVEEVARTAHDWARTIIEETPEHTHSVQPLLTWFEVVTTANHLETLLTAMPRECTSKRPRL